MSDEDENAGIPMASTFTGDLWMKGQVDLHLTGSGTRALLTLKADGSYALGGTVKELLACPDPIAQALGAVLAAAYYAGRNAEVDFNEGVASSEEVRRFDPEA